APCIRPSDTPSDYKEPHFASGFSLCYTLCPVYSFPSDRYPLNDERAGAPGPLKKQESILMSHELTATDYMVSASNLTPWHGLGVVLPGNLTAADALRAA